MTMSKVGKEEALILCSDFENDLESKTVFLQVSKREFITTLVRLINSDEVALFQSQNTCGVASVLYLSVLNYVVSFTKFAINLYKNGVGELNDYVINESHKVSSWAKNTKAKGNFNGVSLVVIGSVRFVENTSLRFRQGTMDGMTWPSEIKSIASKMLNGVLIKEQSFLLGFNLKKIQFKLKNNEQIIFLYRTSSWKNQGNFFKDSWHYIVLKKIKRTTNNLIELRYWDYGGEKVVILTPLQFYKGVIKTFVFSKNSSRFE